MSLASPPAASPSVASPAAASPAAASPAIASPAIASPSVASPSVASVLAESAARRPAHPALVFGDRSYSYAELWDGALRYAAALRARGLGAGDRVALLLPNTPAFPMAYYGILALGCTAVPVHEQSRAPEISHVLRDSGAAALVCAASLLPEAAAPARGAGGPGVGVSGGVGARGAGAAVA
ncbi:AMP-binding protein, partial [Streptomyces sp. NPDC127112]|uniref:AMP-binding protein n=1 Tax=Streptomyces sp. NPDC127112 TaxID=3345364 RepID=UPI00362D44FE